MKNRIRDICYSQYDEEIAEEICFTLNHYFEKYTEKTGKIHPILKNETLFKIINKMETYKDTVYYHFGRIIEDERQFCELIDGFFDTEYGKINGKKINWSLTKFMSDEVLDPIAQRIVEY